MSRAAGSDAGLDVGAGFGHGELAPENDCRRNHVVLSSKEFFKWLRWPALAITMMPKTALAFLAVALLTLTSAPVVDEADAREVIYCVREPCNEPPCIYGTDGACIITVVCVRDDCGPPRFP